MAVTSGLSVSSDIKAARARSALALSWPLLVGFGLFACLANPGGLPLLGDPDSHWHITVGNWMLQHGAVPAVDSFSFTFAGKPWIAKEWLSQLLLAGAYDLGGWGGVVGLGAAALAVSFAMLLRLLLRDLKPVPALLFVGAALTMASAHFLARPHVLVFPFMLWWVSGLVRAVEERRAPRPLLLLAMLFWANMHGGFTLGLVLGGALGLDALAGARDPAERRALFVGWAKFGLAALLAACLTPYGAESFLVTLRIFDIGASLGMIAEWRSPDFHQQTMEEIVLLVGLYLALSRGLRLPLLRLLIVIGLAHLYLRYARNAELLALLLPLVVAPVLARQWPALAADGSRTGPLNALAGPAGPLAVACVVAAALAIGVSLIRFGDVTPPGSNQPQAALDYARRAGLAGPGGGHVLNDYDFGGYLIQEGVPTFIDGRGELYGGEFIARYNHAVFLGGDESLETLLDAFAIDWTLLGRNKPANKLLAHLPGWHRAYGDDQAVIYVRDR